MDDPVVVHTPHPAAAERPDDQIAIVNRVPRGRLVSAIGHDVRNG
jgi:hypothetical protein